MASRWWSPFSYSFTLWSRMVLHPVVAHGSRPFIPVILCFLHKEHSITFLSKSYTSHDLPSLHLRFQCVLWWVKRNCDLIDTLSQLADRRSRKCIRLLEMREKCLNLTERIWGIWWCQSILCSHHFTTNAGHHLTSRTSLLGTESWECWAEGNVTFKEKESQFRFWGEWLKYGNIFWAISNWWGHG